VTDHAFPAADRSTRHEPARPRPPWREYLDERNAAAREKRRQARADRTCPECGTDFTPSRSDGVYCSHRCRQVAYRTRKATREEEDCA
jgi:hypothetical protein